MIITFDKISGRIGIEDMEIEYSYDIENDDLIMLTDHQQSASIDGDLMLRIIKSFTKHLPQSFVTMPDGVDEKTDWDDEKV